jgi:hypothetical protein
MWAATRWNVAPGPVEVQVVAANRTSLLILNPNTSRPRVVPDFEVLEGTSTCPLWWIVMRRFDGAQLIDRALGVSTVRRAKIRGIASPTDIGAPLFPYFLLITLGILTLSTPLLVSLDLEGRETLSFQEIKNYISKLIMQNPDVYTHASAQELLRRIDRASTFDNLVVSIGRD